MVVDQDNPARKQDASIARGTQFRNLLIVLAAVALSMALFLGLRTQTKTVSLDALAKASTPLEVAFSNGKPTLIEFYANWCTSCQAMAPAISDLKQQYDHQVNFALLNVDNSKWLPEMLHYDVTGIPHFVFLNGQGEAVATAVGQQPQLVMADNVSALVANAPLPYGKAEGKVSALQKPVKVNADDPRAHGQTPVQ
ncbi:MAG TPA: thioredoxin family protein [Candidatus Caenarcaniphilales bacterium]